MSKLAWIFIGVMLAMVLPARADLTWTDAQDINLRLEDALFTCQPLSVYWEDGPYPGDPAGVLGARLTIHAEGIGLKDNVRIAFLDDNGWPHGLGRLNAGQTLATTFDVDPGWLSDAGYELWVSAFRPFYAESDITIRMSVMEIIHAPAPPAVLMGLFGMGAVALWKRRLAC